MFKTFKSSRLYRYIFVLLLIIGTFFATARSSWNLSDGKINLDNIFSAEYVCLNKNTSTEYYRVEDALDKAKSGDVIYCYPGKNPVIRRDCTISNNVSLILPYEGETWNGRKSGENFISGPENGKFADCDSAHVSKYLKNTLTLSSNVTLSIEGGKFYIGGILGHESQTLGGHTSGNYTQVLMESNSKIIAKKGFTNEIQCFGYIKEKYTGSNITNNSEVIFESGTTVNLPFVIYDYRGGRDTVGSYRKGGISPFSVFDFPNIQVLSKIYYGAKVVGFADLYTNETKISFVTIKAQHNTANIDVIGTANSMINLKNDAYLTYRYIHDDLRYTTAKATSYSKINFYGGFDTGNLKMTVRVAVITEEISTENVLFPLSYRLNIRLNDGVYDLNTKYKLMTGAHFYSNKDSTVNFNKDFIIYNSYSDTGHSGDLQYPNKEKAEFIINGKTNIIGPFGGLVQTNNDKEQMILTIQSKSLTVTSVEGKGDTSGLSATDKFDAYDQPDLTQTARGEVLASDKLSHPISNFESSVYISNKNESYFIKADNLGSYKIVYNLDGGLINDSSANVTMSYPIFKGESNTLNGLSIDDPVKRFYKFDGWEISANSDYTNGVSPNGFSVTDNGAYYAKAKYSLATYNITYSYVFPNDEMANVDNSLNEIKSFTRNDLPITLSKAKSDGLYFNGWFVNNNLNSPTMVLDESISNVGYDDIDLTCLFTNSKTFTIKFIDNEYSSYYNEGALNTQRVTKNSDIVEPYPINCNENPDFPKYLDGFYDQHGNKFDANYVLNDQDDVITFTAKWIDKKALTYFDEKGNEISKQYFKEGTDVTLKSIKDFDNTDYTNPKDETPGADRHTYSTLSGYTNVKDGNKTHELGSKITILDNLNLYPYYDVQYTHLLECKINASQGTTFGSDGSYNVNIDGKDIFDVKKTSGTNKYVEANVIITITINKAYYSWGLLESDRKYYNWSITGVDSSLFIDSNVSSGNTKTSHTIKFKMPGKKVTINLWK